MLRHEFPGDYPRHKAMERIWAAKKPGRKHLHQPSQKVVQKRRIAAVRRQREKHKRWARYKRAVHEYFLGLRDAFPKPPTETGP